MSPKNIICPLPCCFIIWLTSRSIGKTGNSYTKNCFCDAKRNGTANDETLKGSLHQSLRHFWRSATKYPGTRFWFSEGFTWGTVHITRRNSNAVFQKVGTALLFIAGDHQVWSYQAWVLQGSAVANIVARVGLLVSNLICFLEVSEEGKRIWHCTHQRNNLHSATHIGKKSFQEADNSPCTRCF